MASFRSKVITAVATLLVLLFVAAVLFPVFAKAKVSMGPDVVGWAKSTTNQMKTYYGQRPERIQVWTSRSGAPVWLNTPALLKNGRSSWNYVSHRLEEEGGELSIAPTALGRFWAELREDEPVLVATFRRKPTVEVFKYGWYPTARPNMEHPKVENPKAKPARVRPSESGGA